MLWKVVKFTALAEFYLVKVIVDYISSGFTGSSRSSGGSNNSNSKRKLKSAAQFQARQKQKNADHAWNHAKKQARHNPNSPHFNSRLNNAKSEQRDANKAAKKARKL